MYGNRSRSHLIKLDPPVSGWMGPSHTFSGSGVADRRDLHVHGMALGRKYDSIVGSMMRQAALIKFTISC